MTTRATSSHVTFRRPFRLAEIDRELPPGTYEIVTEEDVIEGNERTVYIRASTIIWVRSLWSSRMVTIDPSGLEAALLQDSVESS